MAERSGTHIHLFSIERENRMQCRSFRVCFTAIMACFLMNQASALVPDLQHWRFDHYAREIIVAASGNNEQAMLGIERQAQSDPSPKARAYVFLAKALRERLHFRLVSADHFAMQCMSAAKDAAYDEAFALCGWLRMNLAASDGDYKRVALISGQIEAANHHLMRLAGVTDREVENNPALPYLRGPGAYADLRSRETPSIHTSVVGPEIVPFTYDKHAKPLVEVRINGTATEFLLDTGTPQTTVSRSLAAKLGLDVTRHHGWLPDVLGHHVTYKLAFVKSLSVGTFTIDNFPVVVAKLGHQPPILGMDFLLRVGRFTIRHDKLTLNPEVDTQCHSAARFSMWSFNNPIFPHPPRMGIETRSNYGRIYGMLDTGDDDYLAADWRKRKYFGINDKGGATFHIESIETAGADSALTAYVSRAIDLQVRGMTYRRTLRLYTNLDLPLHLNLGFQTTRDFSYYFDVVNGAACMRAIRGPAS